MSAMRTQVRIFLAVAATIAIAVWAMVSPYCGMGEDAVEQIIATTRHHMRQNTADLAVELREGKLRPNAELKDVWETHLRLELRGVKVIVFSAGQDKAWGTEDDLVAESP